LRYLSQNDITELDAAVMKDGLVRADDWPLVFRASGADSLARGVRVRVRITGSDELTLDLHASVIAKIAVEAEPADAAQAADDQADDAGDDADSAGPLTLAIDLSGDGNEGKDAPSEAVDAAGGASAPPQG
jgi:exoribonuclease-2